MAIEKNGENVPLSESIKKRLYNLSKNDAKKITFQNLSISRRSPKEEMDGTTTKDPEIYDWWETISEEMLTELLSMEWTNNFTASKASKFGEDFPTWPYGMVYKWIDEKWKPLKTPINFIEGEKVSPEWAKKNARACHNFRAKARSKELKAAWYKYTQNQLDALTSARSSWKAKENFQKVVMENRNNKDLILEYWKDHATRDRKGIVRWWLVKRREFEIDRFKWDKRHYKDYKA